MKKIKRQYRDVGGVWHWLWGKRGGIAYEHGWGNYYRHVKWFEGEKMNVDHRNRSRGWYVRSWKDVSRRKKQWVGH